MKLLTEKEIEEIAKNIAIKNDLACLIPISGSGVSCHEHTLCDHEVIELVQNSTQGTQKLLLESASENFNQWIYKYPDKCDLRDFEKPNHNYFVAKEGWQACSLSHAKKMQEKDAEIAELKYYKEQWQSIAGKANLKNLIETADKLKKENEELKGDIKKLLNVREIIRSKSVSMRAFAIIDRVFNPIKEKRLKGEEK